MSEYLPSSLLLFIYADPSLMNDRPSEVIIIGFNRHLRKDHRVTACEDLFT